MMTVFAVHMPLDTVPRISLSLRATVKNMGTQTVAAGVPIKLQITGPNGYVYEDFDQATTTALARRASQTITFTPAWRIPDTAGTYTIKVWSELANDEYRFNDTITRSLGVAAWLTYANWANPYWIIWRQPQRATRFNPADFRLSYPFEITRVKHQFYWHEQAPWPDSIFQFRIYGDDGSTLLYESDTIKAVPYPRAVEHPIEPPVTVTSGTIYLAVVPRHYTGRPSTLCDNTPQGKSFYGSPGAWTPEPLCEYFNAISVRALAAISEMKKDALQFSIEDFLNPRREIKIYWQVPAGLWMRINLCDATGRIIRRFFKPASSNLQKGVITLSPKDLKTGIYIVHLTTPKGVEKRKVVIF